MTRERLDRDDGAAALFIAAALVLLLGMAALAVDAGLGFNERRVDQTAADVGVMAGALDAGNGVIGIRDQALNYVRQNLSLTYTDQEWLALWDGCTDTHKADTGYNFVSVPCPGGHV